MEAIRESLARVVKDLYGDLGVDAEVVEAPANFRADYSSNVAFLIAGKERKKPREVAEALVKNWPAQGALENSSTKGAKKQEGNDDGGGGKNGFRDKPGMTGGGEMTGGGRSFDFAQDDRGESDVSVEVAGAGFLNFTVGDELLQGELSKFRVAGVSKKYKGKVVVTEFSDPNPFKVLHVGHLYTSIVGDAISRLVEYAGGEVHRVNFGGDVGLHVGKTMWAIKQKLGKFSVNKLPRGGIALRMNWIAERYVEGSRAYEDDEKAKAEIVEINKEIYKVSTSKEKKSGIAKVYWKCRGWSYEYFEAFYRQIGVKFEKYYPESTVAELGLETVKKHTPKVYEESKGAIVFKGEKYGLHTRVFVNKHGLPTYEAKDVGLIEQKWKDYKFDESVVITGADITEYMKVVLKSIEQYQPKLAERTRHIVHGNVILPGAVKMSSRKGNFLRAIEVLDMVHKEEEKVFGKDVAEEMQKRRMEMLRVMMKKFMRYAVLRGRTKQELSTMRSVVEGAARYAFLKSKIGPDNIVFDPKESVNLHGNSGPYLQYALVRAKSILKQTHSLADSLSNPAVRTRRMGNTPHLRSSDSTADFIQAERLPEDQRMDEWERELLKKILGWKGVVAEAVEELQPYKVCGYLYELAQEFSRFYEHDKVVGGDNETLRLGLTRKYAEVLEAGLGLLGIPVMEKM